MYTLVTKETSRLELEQKSLQNKSSHLNKSKGIPWICENFKMHSKLSKLILIIIGLAIISGVLFLMHSKGNLPQVSKTNIESVYTNYSAGISFEYASTW